MRQLRRRHFLQGSLALAGAGLLVGCGLPVWPGQPASRIPGIGLLLIGTPGPTRNLEALNTGIRDLGYVEGQNLALEWRYAQGRPERLPELAAELVRLPLAAIVAIGDTATRAAQEATDATPIVGVDTGDLVGIGYAASLARPGGNVTGLTNLAPQLAGKRLELAKMLFPGLSRAALLWNPDERSMLLQFTQVAAAAETLGVTLQSLEVRDANEFERAFDAAATGGAEVLLTVYTGFFNRTRAQLNELALRRRLPTVSGDPDLARGDGLIAYGPDLAGLYRRAFGHVDRILKGARPADLPIEQPTAFDLVINLRTAAALGLSIPPAVLSLATEVIQ